jgi:hypothetical protein
LIRVRHSGREESRRTPPRKLSSDVAEAEPMSATRSVYSIVCVGLKKILLSQFCCAADLA